jgi:ParB/RepB/Spo0J family partition protein
VSVARTKPEFRELPVGLINPPTLPSRATMDEQALDELTDNIRLNGLLQPLIVARLKDRYEVVAGHRRYMACVRAGLVAAPCMVYPSVDAATERLKYAENRFREDLNPADEALWFAELLERDHGGDVDKLCEALGEKRHYVEGRLILLRGDERVFEELQKGTIGIGVAQELNKCTEQQYRRMLLHQSIVGGSTKSIVAGWVMAWRNAIDAAGGIVPELGEPAAVAGIPAPNPFVCYCCGKTNDPHIMQSVFVHQHCKLAVLDELLASYRGTA